MLNRDDVICGLRQIDDRLMNLYRSERDHDKSCEYLDMADIVSTAADMLDKTGHWIVHNYMHGVDRYECSECGRRFVTDISVPHCPWCGVEMNDRYEERVDD